MRRTGIGVCVLSILSVIGCGGSPTSPSSTNGNFTLMMRDSPYADAKAVLVTFSSVDVHSAGGAARALAFAGGATTRTCDLKKLETSQDLIGTATLEAGQYTMVRLTVSSAALYFDNPSEGPACAPVITPPAGNSAPLEIPSGVVRLNRGFEVSTSGSTTMLVDFDGDQSIRATGNGRFLMVPVIAVLDVQVQ